MSAGELRLNLTANAPIGPCSVFTRLRRTILHCRIIGSFKRDVPILMDTSAAGGGINPDQSNAPTAEIFLMSALCSVSLTMNWQPKSTLMRGEARRCGIGRLWVAIPLDSLPILNRKLLKEALCERLLSFANKRNLANQPAPKDIFSWPEDRMSFSNLR